MERPWKQPPKIAGSPVPVEIRIVALDYLASILVQLERVIGIIRVPSIFIVGGAGVMLHILVKLLVLVVQMMSVLMDITVTPTLPGKQFIVSNCFLSLVFFHEAKRPSYNSIISNPYTPMPPALPPTANPPSAGAEPPLGAMLSPQYKYCGTDYGDATTRCWQPCESNSDCCFGQSCK